MNVQSLKKIINNSTNLVTLFVIGALFLAACAGATPQPNPPATEIPATVAPAATDTAMAPMAMEPTISVAADAKLGNILVGDNGMTLYITLKDSMDKSTCNAACLAKWPPLITQGNPTLGAGVDKSLIGYTLLDDGRKLVTYNHMPLYYWVNDKKAGDTTGLGIGNVWYLLGPDGKVVGNTPAATPTSSASGAFTEPTISIASDAKLGDILVGDKGMTLYIYTKDTADTSNCAGGCLKAWPPLLTQGKPNLGPGVDSSKIGTAKLADGSMIVTYNHMPLYYWAKDTKAGDTTGQGVGSVWFVIGPDGNPIGNSSTVPTTAPTMAPMASEPTISVVTDPKLGQILVGDKGMTLYIFTNDTPDKSNCSGGCLKAWPPLLTQGKPNLGPGVDASKIGSTKLADGTLIVTYNHMPLYYWAKDTKAGDTTGQGVGSVWYVIGPDGNAVMK